MTSPAAARRVTPDVRTDGLPFRTSLPGTPGRAPANIPAAIGQHTPGGIPGTVPPASSPAASTPPAQRFRGNAELESGQYTPTIAYAPDAPAGPSRAMELAIGGALAIAVAIGIDWARRKHHKSRAG